MNTELRIVPVLISDQTMSRERRIILFELIVSGTAVSDRVSTKVQEWKADYLSYYLLLRCRGILNAMFVRNIKFTILAVTLLPMISSNVRRKRAHNTSAEGKL